MTLLINPIKNLLVTKLVFISKWFYGLETMKYFVESPTFLILQPKIYLTWNLLVETLYAILTIASFQKKNTLSIIFNTKSNFVITRAAFSNSNYSTQALCNCCCRQQLPPTSSFRTDDSRSIFSIHFQGALLKPFSNSFKKSIQPFWKEPLYTKSNSKYRFLQL